MVVGAHCSWSDRARWTRSASARRRSPTTTPTTHEHQHGRPSTTTTTSDRHQAEPATPTSTTIASRRHHVESTDQHGRAHRSPPRRGGRRPTTVAADRCTTSLTAGAAPRPFRSGSRPRRPARRRHAAPRSSSTAHRHPRRPAVRDAAGQLGRRAAASCTPRRCSACGRSTRFGTVVKTHRVSGKLTRSTRHQASTACGRGRCNTCAIHNPSIMLEVHGALRHTAPAAATSASTRSRIQYGQPVQTVDQLGEPLSGGCVRQATPDAIWMWDWAQLGTVVVVLA